MLIYLVRELRGTILGAYDNERAAHTHLEAIIGRIGLGVWRNDALYVRGLYAGRVESVEVRAEYQREVGGR